MSQDQPLPCTGGRDAVAPRRSTGRSGAALAGATALGALTWASWLGWDHTASYDRMTGTVQSPYVTLQVLGCALTVGLLVAVTSALGHPVTGAGGVALGFWVPWTIDAASRDQSGLFAVGAVLLALGLAAGTTVAALVGAGVGVLLRAMRRRQHAEQRGPSD